jgi:lysyl-tRNA synthetase class 2
MTLETVQSTAIHALGYDPKTATLEIIFTGGGIYIFRNVPRYVYYGLRAAVSKGGYFRAHIMGRYRHDRLGRYRRATRRSVKGAPAPPRQAGDARIPGALWS